MIVVKNRLQKAKRMAIGTISRGRKKVAEGKWIPVKKKREKKKSDESTAHREYSIKEALSLIINSDKNFAIRGDDYIPQEKFEDSRYHGDDAEEFTHNGVSAIFLPGATEKYLMSSVMDASKYGKNIFILSGDIINADPEYHDPNEVLVQNNKIEGIIKYDKPKKEKSMTFKDFVEYKNKKWKNYDFTKRDSPEWKPIVEEYNSYIDKGTLKKGKLDSMKHSKSRIIVKSMKTKHQKLADKHGVSLEQIEKELAMGDKVEFEHTSDKLEAHNIAMEHIIEDPEYYSKLKASGLADELEKAIKIPAQKKFDLVMHEFEVGALADSHGNLVTDRDQALAIAYSESGMSKSQIIVKSILRKAKYLKRWKVKGKWRYKYIDDSKRTKIAGSEEMIPASRFNAESYYDKTNDPNATVDTILATVSPEIKTKIQETETKLKSVIPTITKYRKSGEGASAVYDTDRAKLHQKIIEKMFMPDKINSALPAAGKQPTFMMLGGRGGCLSFDHEYLTDSGWKPISKYKKGERVLVFDSETNTTHFELPDRYINLPCDSFYHIKSRGLDLMVSEEHTILHNKKFNPEKWRTIKAIDLVEENDSLSGGWDGMIPCSFYAPGNVKGISLSEVELRLMVAICADGNFSLRTTKRCRISVRKTRKKERLEMLLIQNNIKFKTYENKKRPTEIRYSFNAPENNKNLSAYWGATPEQLRIISEEVIHWDGWTDKYKAWKFSSTNKKDIDFVSYLFSTQGRRSSFYRDDRQGTGWSPIWRVSAGVNPGFAGIRGGGDNSGISIEPSVDGRKYCFTVSTGFFITRRNDCICITGNSGKSWFNGKVYDPDKNIVIDADEIKKQLPEYEGWNAFEVHEESSDIVEKVIAMAKAYKLNIVIDATMKTTSSAVDRAKDFKASGYDIKAHYMHAPRQISAQRAVKRFAGPTGRYVPVGVVLSNVSNEKTFDAVKRYASSWSFMDSSGDPPPNMISKKNGVYTMAKAIENEESSREKANPDAYDMYDFGPVVDEKDYSQDLKDMIERNRPKKMKKSIMIKAKYLKRWKNRGVGKWQYKYHPSEVSTKTEGFKKGELFIIDMGKGPEKVTFIEAIKRGNKEYVRLERHQTGYPDKISIVEASVFKDAIVDKPVRKSIVVMKNLFRKARRQKIITMAKLKTIAVPKTEYDHAYKLQGKKNWHGLSIGIENKKGSYRRGKDADGKPWETYMNFDYGRIGGSKAVDNEGVDIYMGPDDTAEMVYVVHQQDPFKKCYDEDKAMCNFPSKESAVEGYLSQYDRPDFLGPVSEFTIPEFKAALKERRGTMLYRSPNQFRKSQIIVRDMQKAKKMAIGTESKGRKKVAEGKWVPIKSEGKSKILTDDQVRKELEVFKKKYGEEDYRISFHNWEVDNLKAGTTARVTAIIKQGHGNNWADIQTFAGYLTLGKNKNVKVSKEDWKKFKIGNMDSNLKKSRIIVKRVK